EIGTGTWSWIAPPDEPLGRYMIEAIQGQNYVATMATTRAPQEPKIYASSWGYTAGMPVRLELGGFPPGQSVHLMLYKAEQPDEWTGFYLTEIPSLTINNNGGAILTLSTAADDSPGKYGIGYIGSSVLLASFYLEVPRTLHILHVSPGA